MYYPTFLLLTIFLNFSSSAEEIRPPKPAWISLDYQLEKESYFLGESIPVRFVLTNYGREDFPIMVSDNRKMGYLRRRLSKFLFSARNERGEKVKNGPISKSYFRRILPREQFLKPGESFTQD